MCEDEDIKALQGLVGRAPINVLQMLGATRFADKLSDPPASHTSDLYRLAAIVCTDGVDLRTIHLSSVSVRRRHMILRGRFAVTLQQLANSYILTAMACAISDHFNSAQPGPFDS